MSNPNDDTQWQPMGLGNDDPYQWRIDIQQTDPLGQGEEACGDLETSGGSATLKCPYVTQAYAADETDFPQDQWMIPIDGAVDFALATRNSRLPSSAVTGQSAARALQAPWHWAVTYTSDEQPLDDDCATDATSYRWTGAPAPRTSDAALGTDCVADEFSV